MNNVDLAIQKVRELQSELFKSDASPNSLFKKTQVVIEYMERASKEINTNYKDISDKLTRQMNTGKPQE